MVERRSQRNQTITSASQENISTEASTTTERPTRARKRAKTAHVKAETEQGNGVDGQQPHPQAESLLEEPPGITEKPEQILLAVAKPISNSTKRNRKVHQAKAVKDEHIEIEEDKPELTVKRRKDKVKEEEDIENVNAVEEATEESAPLKPKIRRKKKTKAEKEAEAMPLAARSVGLRMLIGAHVSAAKGGLFMSPWAVQIAGVPIIYRVINRTKNPLFSQFRSAQRRLKLRTYRVNNRNQRPIPSIFLFPFGSFSPGGE